jgi:hypothetical protein
VRIVVWIVLFATAAQSTTISAELRICLWLVYCTIFIMREVVTYIMPSESRAELSGPVTAIPGYGVDLAVRLTHFDGVLLKGAE